MGVILEDFTMIDNYIKTIDVTERQDKQYRRYFFTWNNPFWDKQFEEVDITNTDLKLNLDKYDLYYLKKYENIELFDFKCIKYKNRHTNEDEAVIRPFFKSDESIKEYLKNLSNFRYGIFQIEKGGNSELIHIQGFIQFSKPFNWSTFCRCFPVADFSDVYSNSIRAREYCSKEDTRVRGPYEIGDFVEERGNSKTKEFLNLINMNAKDEELMEYSPTLYLNNYHKIEKIQDSNRFRPFMKGQRQVEVTYIYGPPGVGKTTFVRESCNEDDLYNVDTYKYGGFDMYKGQNIIVFDEYNSQIELTLFNKLIDKWAVQLPARYGNKWACYTKIFIISNIPISEQYNSDNIKPEIRKAFFRRIHNIIRFTGIGKYVVEKGMNCVCQNLSIDDIVLIPTNDDELPF